MAERGFTANHDAIAGPRGWGLAFFRSEFDADALLTPIGRGRALEPGPSWKLFPSQYGTHFGITAALEAREHMTADLPADSIEQIELRVPSMPYIDRPNPGTGLEGKFSWQYTSTLALLDGRVDTATFTDRRRRDPLVDALLQRFHLITDPEITGTFDEMHVDLRVRMRGGADIETRCDTPLGSWRRPVDPHRIRAKAQALLDATFGSARTAATFAAIPDTNRDFSVRVLMATLR
jgi:aconitate decarboxylase